MKRWTELLTCALLLLAASDALAQSFNSYALVNDDGTLSIRGRRVRLYGIYIPTDDRTCLQFVRPVRCGARPVLQLDFKIGSSFVDCNTIAQNADGTVSAQCSVDGEDLSRWMLTNGWAAALPDAPFEYQFDERIAERRGLGIWGYPLDTLPRQLRPHR